MPSIDARTAMGPVHLAVSDLGRAAEFYQTDLGLVVLSRSEDSLALGVTDRPLLTLTQTSGPPRRRGTTGLYHFALLVPTRADLAQALMRLVHAGTPMQGFADHGVSEALYLADPDANGIEIYRDRPRAEWPTAGGRLQMTVDPLDTDSLLAEAGRGLDAAPLPPGTTMGHVHLHVSDLSSAHEFYVDVLGFDEMQRYGPGALFVSAGGYHHHVGLNTWAGIGAPPPPPDAVGLRSFTVEMADRRALDEVLARVTAAGLPVETTEQGTFVNDPSENRVLLTVRCRAPGSRFSA